jgi:predicted negative regulator of RcsB-dependent stress response
VIPTIPNKYVMLGVGVVLSLGVTFSYGYYKGSEAAREKASVKLLEATEKLLESEKALARVASRLATEASQKLSQGVSRGVELQKEYEDAKPHEVDPHRCVSDDQYRVLVAASKATTPGQ